MDRAHLESRYLELEVKQVVLYLRDKDGYLLIDDGILIDRCEQWPIDEEDEVLFYKISHDVERCIWNLFTPMFKRLDGKPISQSGVTINHGSLIKEQCGKEHLLVRPVRQCAGTKWRCPSVEWLGDSMVKG